MIVYHQFLIDYLTIQQITLLFVNYFELQPNFTHYLTVFAVPTIFIIFTKPTITPATIRPHYQLNPTTNRYLTHHLATYQHLTSHLSSYLNLSHELN